MVDLAELHLAKTRKYAELNRLAEQILAEAAALPRDHPLLLAQMIQTIERYRKARGLAPLWAGR
jgi:hypothetical protein